jgi:hypothetical protein
VTDSVTFADLRRLAPLTMLGVEFGLATASAVKVEKIEAALDIISADMASNRKYHQSKDEDLLTTHIVGKFRDHGFDAAHDADTSGHPDIKISERTGFEWLCEAKVHHGYKWLCDGFSQLTTRYSSGTEHRDHGCMLIYCYGMKAQNVLEEWLSELTTTFPFVKCGAISAGFFKSTHDHEVSGITYTVHHKIIGLYYKPKK